eukprot:gene4561-7945_t
MSEEENSLLLNSGIQTTDNSGYPVLNDEPIYDKAAKKEVEPEKLGQINGVVIPVILSMWGVILYLRLGVVVGQAGFLGLTLIFFVSYCITTLTIVSISAIVTNGSVKGGGVYYFVSRSLGPELGGSIGLIYALGQIVTGGLCVVGFTDTLVEIFPKTWPEWVFSSYMKFAYGAGALIILTIVCFIGADFFAKTNLMLFLFILASLITVGVSLLFQTPGIELGFVGPSFSNLSKSLWFQWQKDFESPENTFDFRYAFGIIFPACTGMSIMVGANLSGDIQNPERDIPNGTFIGKFFTLLGYLVLAFLYALTVTRQALVEDPAILMKLAFVPHLITIGIFFASLSSTLSVIVGVARIFQAIARDQMLPFIGFFAKGSGKSDEPRRAIVLVFVLILGIVAIGEINIIAPIVSVLTSMTYTFVNLSCFFLAITGAPNFRPSFRLFSWYQALLGAILSVFAMFFVSPMYAGIAIIIQILLIISIHYYAPTANWGDFSDALIYHQVRKYLLRMNPNTGHIKNWRLQCLLFVANPKSSLNLIDFVNSLKKGGLYIVGHVKVGDFRKMHESISQDFHAFEDYFETKQIKAFPEIAIADNVRVGCQNLVTNSGIGGMRPNTVIVGFFDPQEKPVENEVIGYSKRKTEAIEAHVKKFTDIRDLESPNLDIGEYIQILKDCQISKKNICIARHFYNFNKTGLKPSWSKIFSMQFDQKIDIWLFDMENWRSNESNAHLLLQLGHLLHHVGDYRKYHKLRVLGIVDTESEIELESERLNKLVKETRIIGEVKVFSICDIFSSQSKYKPKADGKCFRLDELKKKSTQEQYQLINNVIKRESERTSIAFLPLPPLPLSEKQSVCHEYLEELQTFTNDLPPCLLVEGNEDVISLEF